MYSDVYSLPVTLVDKPVDRVCAPCTSRPGAGSPVSVEYDHSPDPSLPLVAQTCAVRPWCAEVVTCACAAVDFFFVPPGPPWEEVEGRSTSAPIVQRVVVLIGPA